MSLQEPAGARHPIARRDALRYAALVGAGVAATSSVGLLSPAAAHDDHDDDHDHEGVLPPPRPIPGGIAPGLHVFAPGPPEVTLPFSGLQLQGLDVEPSVMTDYAGFTALAFHAGTAVANDGTRYNLETDMRAYRGRYVASDGTTRHGAFGFV
jgi:hypothetical protein